MKRKETSTIKPTDLWTQEDDLLFLKYCPSKRERAYHMVSRDTSARPHEILNLKIKDIIFKLAGNTQYAEVLVNGKTGTRSIPLINSIPYVKDYLDNHPQRSNPNAYFIFPIGRSFGKRMHRDNIATVYAKYKKRFFPQLLKDPKVLPEDKAKIRELLKKPWNPYIRRHSALTEKAQILKESTLRQHAGWSGGSNMHQKYIHYFGNESSENLLEAYGIKPKTQDTNKLLQPVSCPNCAEPNQIDSRFCVKCRMILSYDSYLDTMEQRNGEIEKLSKYEEYMTQIAKQIIALEEKVNSFKNRD